MSQVLPKLPKADLSQVLISLLVAIGLFAILAHALFTLVSASYALINYSRARITARHLAQEKLELIRNLPYNLVGTVGGIPAGPIEQIENIERNGLNYTVKASVVYIDDPFDELAPDDLLPTDYKRVRIDAAWGGLAASRKNPVTLISDIAPSGIETTEGGGTLSILVFDANAIPVPQADILIIANETDPPVSLSLKTADNGRIILPGTPTCIDCYQITVTKEGYSSDRTYSTEEIANPNKPHLSVLEGSLTEISFAIDEVSTLDIETVKDRDNNFESLGNVTLHLRGSKTLGTDVEDESIYKLDEDFTTDDGGKITIENLEWDNYEITVSGSSWDISGTNPLLPLEILPDKDYDLIIALSTYTDHNLLTTFTDTAEAPIASVAARLFDEGGFEATASSGLIDNPDFGQVFFSNLSEQIYFLQATVSGYLDFDGSVDVSGYTTEKVILNEE